MFLPGQCYQFIHISCCGMHAFRSQGIHDSSHFVYRDAAHGCRISFQQDIEQAYCRVKFEVFPFLRQSETMENHFRFGRQGIIGLVAQFQLGFLRRRESVTLSFVQFCFQLGEKLFVLQWRAVYLLLYLGKEITAASAGVGEQRFPVTGADERGHPGQMAVGRAVRLAEIQFFHLHQIFQQWQFLW